MNTVLGGHSCTTQSTYTGHLSITATFSGPKGDHCTLTHTNVCTYKHTHLMMIPLSTEKLSVGRPEMFHSRIFTGSPRVVLRENSSERGIPFAEQNLHHSLIWSYRKNTSVNTYINTTSSLFLKRIDIHPYAHTYRASREWVVCMYVCMYTLTCLKEEVKAPKYATSPADISTSPVRLL